MTPRNGPQDDLVKKALLIGGIFLALLVLLVLFLVFSFPSSSILQKEVAIIPLKGEISSESSGGFGSTYYSSQEIVDLLEDAKNDPAIGVIFLDIDSGGGSVVASKQIVYKVREVKQTKPVVSYIGEVGASGAYYVASAGNYIISDADSITGSIGVISIVPNVQELLEKIGVKVEIIKAGKFKAAGSPFEELSDEERQMIESIIQDTFVQFKSDVLSFRQPKLSPQVLDRVADGRILSGRQALSLNLVDELLPREQAIEKAARIGGITGKPVTQAYSKPALSIFDLFLLGGQAFGQGLRQSVSVVPIQSVKVRA